MHRFLRDVDMQVLDGQLDFASTTTKYRVDFEIELVAEARLHEKGSMASELAQLPEGHFLVVLQDMWFAVNKGKDVFHLYNCHRSPVSISQRFPKATDTAAIVETKTAAETADTLRCFVYAAEDTKAFIQIYVLKMKLRASISTK